MSGAARLASVFFAVHLSMLFYLYPENVIGMSHFGQWAPILAGYAIELVFLLFYLSGLSAFPREDVADILSRWGVWAARLLLLPLLTYFFTSLVLLNRSHAEIAAILFLPNTPIWALQLLMLVIPLRAAAVGFASVQRGAIAILLFVAPLIAFSLASCFQNANLNYLFPLQADGLFWRKELFLSVLIPHSGFLFLGMTGTVCNFASRPLRRALFLAMGGLLPFYFLVAYLPILILDPGNAAQFQFPLPAALDTVNLEWLMFDRITMFYVVATIVLIYVYSAVLFWCSTRLVSKLYWPWSPKPLLFGIAAAVYVSCLAIPDWYTFDVLSHWNAPLRLYGIACIPVLAFAVAITNKRVRRTIN
ncbi:GerAB/ArcD/ProY family transporter [Paenibacillus sp.]|uniref:GerAB/ArcD/ProY family transporter n=1 Tax=Paenibacillus sp. TaxID=58172 RepID=UPI0028125D35|nr:GerAB/ArcD/ProY family transporter [Paenibacillus sp.]